MGSLVMFNMVSLDGFFADKEGGIDWHTTDEEFNDFSIDQLASAGGLLFGRRTYELMAGYWPTATDDTAVAAAMNSLPKWVFSRALHRAEWASTTLIREATPETIAAIKRGQDDDVMLFGSANLARSLIEQGAIDEFRLMVSPQVLGTGLPLFTAPIPLDLREARPFQSGNVLLRYTPQR